MTDSSRRTAPVKMIWMFVSLGLMISTFFLAVITKSRSYELDDFMLAHLRSAVPIMLICVSIYVCLYRGSVNLAPMGITFLAGLLGFIIAKSSESVFLAIVLSVQIGAGLGALTGIFAIQSRRKVLLVTLFSSLLLSGIFSALGSEIRSNLRSGSYWSIDTDVYSILIWIGFFVVSAVAVLGGLGRPYNLNEDADLPQPGGGIRFVWMLIAGALAGLAGVLLYLEPSSSEYLRYYTPTSSYSLPTTIIPILLFAGALIPNTRRSAGEGICGGISVLFGTMTLTFFETFLNNNFTRYDNVASGIIFYTVVVLMLIPNLTIGRSSYSGKSY